MANRAIVVIGFGLLVSGCANDRPDSASFSPAGVALSAASVKVAAEPIAEPRELPRKTMSDRVLTAIALERVTGLKPDPARLLQ